jgi:hypothetical protein
VQWEGVYGGAGRQPAPIHLASFYRCVERSEQKKSPCQAARGMSHTQPSPFSKAGQSSAPRLPNDAQSCDVQQPCTTTLIHQLIHSSVLFPSSHVLSDSFATTTLRPSHGRLSPTPDHTVAAPHLRSRLVAAFFSTSPEMLSPFFSLFLYLLFKGAVRVTILYPDFLRQCYLLKRRGTIVPPSIAQCISYRFFSRRDEGGWHVPVVLP